MRQENPTTKSLIAAVAVAIILGIGWLFLQPTPVSAAVTTAAVVSAIEGKAAVTGKEPGEQVPLEQGIRVEPWQTVSTEDKGKVMLRWEHGLVGSLGGFSSALLASMSDRGREIPNIQVLDGLVRVATEDRAGKDTSSFVVTTPMAAIRPEGPPGQPIDFIVEVYEPSTTVITVISGSLKVTKLKGQQPKEEVISACSTIYVEENKSAFDKISLSREDLQKLVDQATISGTMYAQLDSCPLAPAVPPTARREVRPRYAPVPEYEYIDEYMVYDYPWDDIRIISTPTYRDGIVCFIPGYGRYIIPYTLGYAVDPGIWQVYVQFAFADRALYYDRIYYNDLIYQRNALNNVLYLAGTTGNYGLWWDTRRQLRYLDIQSRWAAARINNLERRVSALENDQRRFSRQVPSQVNVANVIANSFNSSVNRNVIQQFENRMKSGLAAEKRLAAATGQELLDFRSRLSGERDPQRRQELRTQFAQVRDQLDKGKIPVSAKQGDVKRLAEQLTKAGDPSDRAKLQQQLVGQLAQRAPKTTPEQLLSPDKLKPLQKSVATFPDARKRPELEKAFAQVERSVAERKQLETTVRQQDEQVRNLRDQFAREQDPGKKDALLKQMQQLKSMAPLAAPTTPSPQERQLIQRPRVGDTGPVKQEEQRRALEEQRKKEADLRRQQQEDQRKQAEIKRQEQVRQQQEQLKKQTEMRRLQQEEQKKQADIRRQQQLREQQVKQQQQRQQEQLQRQQQQRAQEQMQQQRAQEKTQRLQQQRMQEQLQRQQQQRAQEQARQQQQRAQQQQIQRQQQQQREQQQRIQEQMKKQQQQQSRGFQMRQPQAMRQQSSPSVQQPSRSVQQPTRSVQQAIPRQPQAAASRPSPSSNGGKSGKNQQVQLPNISPFR